MNTTIAISKEIRNKASKKAKEDGLSMSSVVRILLLDYASGKIQIGTRTGDDIVIEPVAVDGNTQKMMNDLVSEWNKNK